MKSAALASCVVALILAATAAAETLTLAAGGKPATTIVVPAEADEHVQAAASELQQYVVKLVGVELPVVADDAELNTPAIFVGPCRQVQGGDLPPADANIESYAIRVRDGSLILVGRQWYGTEFAVYSFLEDDLGIRWFVPGPLGEHIPEREQGELTVEVSSRVVEPDFSPRIWSGNHFFPASRTTPILRPTSGASTQTATTGSSTPSPASWRRPIPTSTSAPSSTPSPASHRARLTRLSPTSSGSSPSARPSGGARGSARRTWR